MEASRSTPAAAAGAGAAAGAAGTAATAAPGIIPPAATAEAITKAVRSFWRLLRLRNEELVRSVYKRVPRADPMVVDPLGIPSRGGVTEQDLLEALAEEGAREDAFQRAGEQRLRRDAARVEQIEDPEERTRALSALLSRERSYAAGRAEALTARCLAAVDRAVARRESPEGAYWRRDPGVRKHTRGCVFLSGRVWSWESLARIRPPVHAGCRCHLVPYRTALKLGWVTERDLQDPLLERVAINRALELERLEHTPTPRVQEAFDPNQRRDRAGRWTRSTLTSMRAIMEKIRSLQKVPEGFTYASAEDLVLREGKEYEPQELPERYAGLRGPLRECFRNAWEATQTRPELTYAEGFAASKDFPLPIRHAWAVDPEGRVVEVTWKEPGAAYLGVQIPLVQGSASLARTGTWGMLDDPTWARRPWDAE